MTTTSPDGIYDYPDEVDPRDEVDRQLEELLLQRAEEKTYMDIRVFNSKYSILYRPDDMKAMIEKDKSLAEYFSRELMANFMHEINPLKPLKLYDGTKDNVVITLPALRNEFKPITDIESLEAITILDNAMNREGVSTRYKKLATAKVSEVIAQTQDMDTVINNVRENIDIKHKANELLMGTSTPQDVVDDDSVKNDGIIDDDEELLESDVW